ERRREVQQFIEDDLQDEGLAKSVVVVATSDQPALMRVQGAFVAITIAEYFRDEGKDVMFMMDSATRLAMAQREIGLAIGEPPTTRGYTPSVVALLPKLLERAGTTSYDGSITGLYTVLVEADDLNEPVADTMRSILDGHIVLSRDLAVRNHYPAIDVLSSISRLMWNVTTDEHMKAALKVREILATYNKAEDLINIGAYITGSDPNIDYAIEQIDKVNEYLIQEKGEKYDFDESISKLIALFNSKELN
ncbi:MAG: EscN/YscN/HrcN family type III secretion system ATPase, partial [Candidatus Poribacteria bacterium]